MDDESNDGPGTETGAAADGVDGDEDGSGESDAETSADPGFVRETVDRAGGLDRLWAGTVGGLAAVLILGSLLFTRSVYVEFVWQYFWGPVYADAHGWDAVAWCEGAQVQPGDCTAATSGPVAEPGYTLVSEVGYAFVLILMLVGVGLLIRRLGIERYRAGYFALLPYMFFGGVLRTVEDAADRARFAREEAIQSGVSPAEAPTVPMGYPLNSFFISPVIYFTVFAVAVFGLVLAKYLEDDYIDRGYEYPLAGVGTVALTVTLGSLVYLSATKSYVEFHPAILLVTSAIALASTGLVWYGICRFAPELNQGTGKIGLLVIFGQAVDGAANVIGLDWAKELGLSGDLNPKHPVNEWVVNTTGSVLPADVLHVTGRAWPFLLLKLVAAVLVVWIFDETVFHEDSERYTMLLLVAVLAVGLGPGTRDMVRATFGV